MMSNQILLKIYESYDAGDITGEEFYIYKSIFTEKKSEEIYRFENFVKDYHFVPDKPGSRVGTITVDGKKIKVDAGKAPYNDPPGKVIERPKGVKPNKEDQVRRETGVTQDLKEPIIVLSAYFWKLKGKAERDAILQHEIGHGKYHQKVNNDFSVSKYPFQTLIESQNKKLINNLVEAGIPYDTSKKLVHSSLRNEAIRKEITRYQKLINKDPHNTRLRKEFYNKVKDIVASTKNTHINTMELEADQHAANKTSEKSVTKALQRYNKLDRKDPYTKYDSDKERRDHNRKSEEDYKIRKKVLENNEVRKLGKKIY